MKILFASGVYIPASGGSEISIHTLLSELKRYGHMVKVITGSTPSGDTKSSRIDGIKVLRVEENKLKVEFNKTLKYFSPDLVLTQLMWSERILLWAKTSGYKTVYFIRSAGHNHDFSKSGRLSPDLILANSHMTQDFVRRKWHRNSYLVYPVIKLADYVVEKKTWGNMVTMFNPIKIKGGEIFKKIALLESDRNFMAVEGWHQWKNPITRNWNIRKLKSNSKAFGSELLIPEEVDFQGVKNIKYQPAIKDVRSIYVKTRLLLVPSIWQEPSARVIVEAMISGIPVICSNTGDSKRIVGSGGLTIDKYTDPEEWVEKIIFFDNVINYKKYSLAAKKQARKFSHEKIVSKVDKLLEQLIG